jgi:hypothetical protein
MSKNTKAKAGVKAAKAAAKRPDLLMNTIGEALAVHAPRAAYDLGLAEPPKSKRTMPRLVAGAVIGASAMYFLEPEHGKEHRDKVAQLVG